MKYINKKNGKVMEIVKKDEQKATMIIQFEDGTTSCISVGTFKRWYKEFDVPEEVTPLIDLDNSVTETEAEELEMITGDEALEQAVVDPDVAGDGTPLADVGKEIAEQAKKKVKRAKAEKKVKKEVNPDAEAIKSFFEQSVTEYGDEIFVPTTGNMRALKVAGRMYAKMSLSKSGVTLYIKSSSRLEGAPESDKKVNDMFDSAYKFDQKLSESVKANIKLLLKGAREQRLSKNTKTSKNTKNKEEK